MPRQWKFRSRHHVQMDLVASRLRGYLFEKKIILRSFTLDGGILRRGIRCCQMLCTVTEKPGPETPFIDLAHGSLQQVRYLDNTARVTQEYVVADFEGSQHTEHG